MTAARTTHWLFAKAVWSGKISDCQSCRRSGFFIVPPALLFSMPISAGGLGLRERVRYSRSPAIVPSLIFGLGILLVTLPGALVWLANRKPDAVETSNR